MHWKGREFALVCVLTVSAPKSRIAMQHMVCFRTSYGIKSRQRTIGIRRWNLDRYRLHLTAVQTNCDQQPSSTNNCLDNTELLPKQQEHSCPDQWSYMLAEQLCPLSNLERSLCHNEIWSSSCNAKCCFACEMPVLISLFEESEFLNHEEENTTLTTGFSSSFEMGVAGTCSHPPGKVLGLTLKCATPGNLDSAMNGASTRMMMIRRKQASELH